MPALRLILYSLFILLLGSHCRDYKAYHNNSQKFAAHPDVIVSLSMHAAVPNHPQCHNWYTTLSPDQCFALPTDLVAWKGRHMTAVQQLATELKKTGPTLDIALSQSQPTTTLCPSHPYWLNSWRATNTTTTHQAPILRYPRDHEMHSIASRLKAKVLAIDTLCKAFPWETIHNENTRLGEQHRPSSVAFHILRIPTIVHVTADPSSIFHHQRLSTIFASIVAAHARRASLHAFVVHINAQCSAATYAKTQLERASLGMWRDQVIGETTFVRSTLAHAMEAMEDVMKAGDKEYKGELKRWMREDVLREGGAKQTDVMVSAVAEEEGENVRDWYTVALAEGRQAREQLMLA